MSASIDKYVRRLARVESDLRNLSTRPRLGNSSIDGGGRLVVNDPTSGETLVVIGTLDDGSTTVQDVGGPAPSQPSAPVASPIPGGVGIAWTGTNADDDPQPWDSTLGYISVRMSTVSGEPGSEIARMFASTSDQYGGAVTVVQPSDVTTYVTLVAVRRSGVESDPSDETEAVGGTYVDPVDLEPLNDALDALQTDLDAAEASLSTLLVTTIPGLSADLATAAGLLAIAQADIDTAEADIDAVEIDVAAATSAISTLTTTTIPDLAADLATAQGDLSTLLSTTIPGLVSDLSDLNTELDGHFPITSTDIATDAITTPKIAANAVTAAEIAAGTITANEIAALAVTTAKLDALAVTAAKIAANTITAAQIAADTITANEIAANAITASEIAANAVTTAKLDALAVTAAKIAANTITAAQIAADTITANEIAADTITANEIAADTITANEIATGAITVNEIAAGTLEAGFVLSGKIQVGVATWTPNEGMIFPDTLVLAAATAQIVTITGAPTGGTFTLSGNGTVTSSIAYNASAATVQTAVRTLGGAFSGALVTAPGAGGPWTIDVAPTLPIKKLTATSSLTGGTSPAVVVTSISPPSSFTGGITATSLTVQKDFNLLGVSNQIKGTLTLANGIVAPTTAPTMWQSWDLPGQHAMPFGSIEYGLTSHLSDGTVLLTAQAFFGGGIIGVIKATGQNTYRYVSADPANLDGTYRAWTVAFNPTGITTLGSNYYVIGRDSNRSNDYYAYKLDSSFNKVAERLMFSSTTAGRAAIGNDGTRILIALTTTASPNTDSMIVWDIPADSNFAAGASGFNNFHTFPGAAGIASSYIGKGSYDLGSTRYVWSLEAVTNFVTDTSGGRLSDAYAFPSAGGGNVRGLHWDGTRFWSLNADGSLYRHAAGSDLVSARTVTSSYTWYDGNSTGSTHETTPSPSASFVQSPRTFINIQTSEAPDSGVTDAGQTDKANRVGIYAAVAAATRRLQQYNDVDVDGRTIRTLRLEAVTTGGQTESTPTGFTGATNSPGLFKTFGASGEQGVIINGDGSARMGGFAVGATGAIVSGGIGHSAEQAATGSTTSNSATNVTITGMSISVTSPGTAAVYMVEISLDWSVGANVTAIAEMLVDGTAQTVQMVYIPASTDRACQSRKWRITGLSAGSHTFTARHRASAANSIVNPTHSVMTVTRVA